MNDGLLDVTLFDPVFTSSYIPKLMENMFRYKGTDIYVDGNWEYARGHSVVIENLNYKNEVKDITDSQYTQKAMQLFQVDGEGLTFNDQVRIDVECNAIEIIVDFEHLMAQTGLMTAKTSTK